MTRFIRLPHLAAAPPAFALLRFADADHGQGAAHEERIDGMDLPVPPAQPVTGTRTP